MKVKDRGGSIWWNLVPIVLLCEILLRKAPKRFLHFWWHISLYVISASPSSSTKFTVMACNFAVLDRQKTDAKDEGSLILKLGCNHTLFCYFLSSSLYHMIPPKKSKMTASGSPWKIPIIRQSMISHLGGGSQSTQLLSSNCPFSLALKS